MKKCPLCAEEIQDAAIKCRYCGEYLNRARKLNGCLTGCLVALAVFFASIIILSYLGAFALRLIINAPFVGWREFHFFPPFMGFGAQGLLNDFFAALRAILEWLKELTPNPIPKYI